MELGKWSLPGLVISCLAMVSLAGCGVSKSDCAALQNENATLTSDLASLQAAYDALNADYETAQNDLAELEAVYPPRDFSSLSELQDWLLANDVSERPAATTAGTLYSKVLEIQEDALRDGFIVSANCDPEASEGIYRISCVTIINGDIWWWSPESDEPAQFTDLGKVK